MAIFNLPLQQIELFIFVIVRVSAILFSIPFLSARSVPVLLKSSLAVAVTVMVIPQLNVTLPPIDQAPILLTIGLIGEAALGILMGLMIQLLVSGVQLAGEMAGFQMGIAIANVMDPTSSAQIPILSQFLNLFAMLLFLVMDMHHYFIKVLIDSFTLVPPLGIQFDQKVLTVLMASASGLFVVAVQIGAPVMVGLLLSSVALALTARTVPQVQIFVVAMPMKILLGLLFMALSMPFCSAYLAKTFQGLGYTLIALLSLL